MTSAVSILVGTIIGAGVFGLPYVVARSGFLLGFLFLLIFGFVILLVHLAYGEVILRTPGSHRLPGFVELYLGKRAKLIVSFSTIVGIYATLLAYMILAGSFLAVLIAPLFSIAPNQHTLAIIIFMIGMISVLFGLKLVERIEFYLSLILGVIFLALFFWALPSINLEHFLGVRPNLENLLPLYGITLFALGGVVAIPELKDVLGREPKKVRKAIIIGTLIPLLLYILFVVTVLGVSGEATSSNAIDGLKAVLGDTVVWAGAFLGIAAVFTSLLVVGTYLKELFQYDFKLPRLVSWLFVTGVPLALFSAGVDDFIPVVALAGSILGGFDGIFILLLYGVAKSRGTRTPEYTVTIPFALRALLIALFTLGIMWELFYFINHVSRL